MKNALFMGIGILANSIKGEDSMTETAQAVKTETEASTEQVLWCPESNIAIFGTHLVSKKLLSLVRLMLLTEEDHGISVLRFTEDLPKAAELDQQEEPTGHYVNTMADYDFESRAVVVNIGCHLETAVTRIMGKETCMRIGSYIHANLIISVLHELFESHKFIDSENPYLIDPETNDDECERMAKDLLIEYAKSTNIEAPELELESDIIRAFITEFEEEAQTSSKDWAQDYCVLLEKNLVHKDGEHEHATLRMYYKRSAEGGGEAVEWPEEVVTVTEDQFNSATPAVTTDSPSISEPASVTAPPVVNPETPAPVVDDVNLYSEDFSGVDFGSAMPPVIDAANMAAPVVNQAPAVSGLPSASEGIPSGSIMPQPAGLPVAPQAAPADAPTLPVYNLTAEQKIAFIKDMCLRMFDYLFNYCGFTPTADQVQPHLGFSQPQAVYGFVPVSDIPFAKEILVGVKTLDEQSGQEIEVDIWNPQVPGWLPGHIRGIVWNKADGAPLPGYKLVINLDGVKQLRSFMPQNPNKRYQDGNLKKWAKAARAGNQKAMLLDDKRGANDKIALTVESTVDGSKAREVMTNPMNPAIACIL